MFLLWSNMTDYRLNDQLMNTVVYWHSPFLWFTLIYDITTSMDHGHFNVASGKGYNSPTRGQISHDFPIFQSATGKLVVWGPVVLDSWAFLMKAIVIPSLHSNISPTSRHFWAGDFPNFPFGWDMWLFPGNYLGTTGPQTTRLPSPPEP